MQTIELSVSPKQAQDSTFLEEVIRTKSNLNKNFKWKIVKRSIDARKKEVKINLRIAVYLDNEDIELPQNTSYKNVRK